MNQIDRAGRFGTSAMVLAGKTAVGLGVGLSLGIAALSAAAVAEIAIPAILTFKALGLTGGAAGFLWGAKGLRKP